MVGSSRPAATHWHLRSLSWVISLTLLVVTGCASLPDDHRSTVPSFALEPDPSTRLAPLEVRFHERHGEDVSGFAAIDVNGEALSWRLALVDMADRSLDIQYYLWYDDLSGMILLAHVIEAAERGVRVRILVDDLLYLEGKSGLANIEAHPNIEIRLFNPWAHKGIGRAFESAARVKRLNHRMHNKLLIADGQMAILGGRNVGDHYFGLHHKYNFHDLDLIVVGDAARESAQIFDHFWNSDKVLPATAFVKEASWQTIEDARPVELGRLRNTEELRAFPVESRDWQDELASLVDRMAPGTATVEFDRLLPDNHQPTQDGAARLTEIAEQAEHEILVINAYIIPGDRMLDVLRAAVTRGVRLRILTNSLASNDVPAVTAKYKKYRKPLLDTGAELYELRAHPEIQPGIIDTQPVEAEFAGLHTKAVVVDRDTVYIGSLNLDPRSIELNTEMGMVVVSPGLAEEVAAIAERDMRPENSWQVRLDEHGKLLWESSSGVVTRQPAQNGWQRFQAWIFGILPEDQL